jgi:hypothetical protein
MKKLLLLLPLLTACAHHSGQWGNTSKTTREFYEDKSYCEAISQQWVPAYGYFPGGQRTDPRRFRDCFIGKGWTEKD